MHESIDVRWREQHRLVLLDEGFDSLAARIAQSRAVVGTLGAGGYQALVEGAVLTA
jgi:hypothetical protein